MGLIIGALTWLCMRKRRDRRQTTELGEGSHIQPQDVAAMTDIAAASSRPQLGGYGPMRESLVSAPVTIPFTTGAADQPPGSSPGPYRAVPQHPQQPGDIASAVEIDSNASPYEDGRMSPASASQQPNFFTAAVPINAVEGTFELYSPQAEQGLPFSPSYAPATSADDEHRRNSRL